MKVGLGWIMTLIVCGVPEVSAQSQYRIQDFSDQYYAVWNIHGSIEVLEKASDKLLITVETEELDPFLENGEVTANIVELPYDEQSLLIYDDFSFDGIKDFALRDGDFSCYGGPSYQVYLGTADGFEYSGEFTRLAQEYCGIFSWDTEMKLLYTATKSGCCWHEYSIFEVVDNEPREVQVKELVRTIVEPHWTSWTIRTWPEGREQVVEELHMPYDADTLFSFIIPRSGKRVVLFDVGKENLFYALLDTEHKVEFSYPDIRWEEGKDEPVVGQFTYDPDGRTLAFTNADAKYTVYDILENGVRKIGVEVTVNGKVYDMAGDVDSAIFQLDIDKATSQGNVKKIR